MLSTSDASVAMKADGDFCGAVSVSCFVAMVSGRRTDDHSRESRYRSVVLQAIPVECFGGVMLRRNKERPSFRRVHGRLISEQIWEQTLRNCLKRVQRCATGGTRECY
jgi:hypothetical protein